jgi:NAD(P)-dependent dehydrogenase (short-subunit alcohol dehydrogenase family)
MIRRDPNSRREPLSVVIIGGTGGLGFALAKAHAAQGHDVVITGRDLTRTTAIAGGIGDNVRAIALDLAEPELVAERLAGIERVDRLAVTAVERDFNTVRDYDIERGRRLVTIKLVGYPQAVHALVGRMGPDASVVLFGGLASERPYPGSTTITMVNGAVASMIRTFAVELAPIRFNAIHPGIIGDTPAWEGKPDALAAYSRRTPGGRLATTEDVVGAVDFLFANKGVNGVNLVIDRGWMLQ